MGRSDTPYVSVMPGMYHGEPCVNGHRLPTRMIADHVFDGAGGTAEDTWDITRDEVLVACWFEARYGKSRTMRQAWRPWLERADPVLWHSTKEAWAGMPMPPTREDAAAPAAVQSDEPRSP